MKTLADYLSGPPELRHSALLRVTLISTSFDSLDFRHLLSTPLPLLSIKTNRLGNGTVWHQSCHFMDERK